MKSVCSFVSEGSAIPFLMSLSLRKVSQTCLVMLKFSHNFWRIFPKQHVLVEHLIKQLPICDTSGFWFSYTNPPGHYFSYIHLFQLRKVKFTNAQSLIHLDSTICRGQGLESTTLCISLSHVGTAFLTHPSQQRLVSHLKSQIVWIIFLCFQWFLA